MLDRMLTILGWVVLLSPHTTCLVLWIVYLLSGGQP
jgi:hypothetical protein